MRLKWSVTFRFPDNNFIAIVPPMRAACPVHVIQSDLL
jgi:hypothetical protein